MRYLIILLIAAHSFAGEFVCSFDSSRDSDAQIKSCKMKILQYECEQVSINIWSNIDVSNNMLVRDEINTSAACDSLNIKVNDVKLHTGKLLVEYELVPGENRIVNNTENKFKDVALGAQTSSTSITRVTRKDSSYVLDINFDFQLDSKKVKQVTDKLITKGKAIWAIATTD